MSSTVWVILFSESVIAERFIKLSFADKKDKPQNR